MYMKHKKDSLIKIWNIYGEFINLLEFNLITNIYIYIYTLFNIVNVTAMEFEISDFYFD